MSTGAWLLVISLAMQSGPTPETGAGRDDQPFAQLLPNLAHDLRALPSEQSGVLAAAGAAGALLVGRADDDLSNWADEHGPSSYTGLGRRLGDGWVQSGAAVATYVTGRLADSPKTAHVGADLIRGQLLNAVLTRGLKIVVDRTRPSGGGSSFPSGHSSAAFTSAAVLDGHFGWKAGAPAYAVAGFIAWTRVRDNAHWLSDVVIGGTIGTIVGRTVTAGHRQRGWVIVPSVSPRAVALRVVRVEP